MEIIIPVNEIVEIVSVELNTVETTGEIVLVDTDVIEYIEVGMQGPVGPVGPSTGSFIMVTGEAIGGHRGVYPSLGVCYYADSSITNQADKLIGVSTEAVDIGEFLNIQSAGELTGFSGLTSGAAVYLQANGILSSVIPTSGFIQQVGVALTATTLLINIQSPIIIG